MKSEAITVKIKGKMFLEGEPWIDIKDSIEKLPGLFRDNYEEEDNFLYLLDLSTQDKFNELVVGVYDDFLYSMEKVDENVKIDKIFYSDIDLISKTEIMLMGKLDIISGDTELAINYNTVSTDVIDELVKKMRKSYLVNASPVSTETLKKLDKSSFGLMFKTIIHVFEAQNENLFYLAFQDQLNISPKKGKIEEEFADLYLGGGLYSSTDKEILIMEKGDKFVEDKEDYHGYRISYIPLNKIASVELATHKSFAEISQLTFNFSKKSSEFLFNRTNSEADKLVDYIKSTIK